MATIAVTPFLLTNCTMKIGADNYEAAISSAEFVPTASAVNWKGLTPAAVFTFATTATWMCNLTFAQDWKLATSLSNYLHTNEGTTVAVEFIPKVGTGEKKVTASLVITPGAIGGPVDSVAVATVALGVLGKPVLAVIP